MTIEPGHHYLLDGKTLVKVLKPVNRAKTIFSIEIAGVTVETVEAGRLQEVKSNPEAA